MAQLAIKSHASRGEEVIEILKMLGGKIRRDRLAGNEMFSWYYINGNGYIDYKHYSLFDNTTGFTLEDFLEKFPYKVGDKVLYHQTYAVINKMKWNGEEIEYVVECKKELWETTIFYLEPYKEETMEKEISGAIVDRFICLEGYDFYDDKGNIIDTKEIIMKKKQPKYPKTYEECCKVLDWNPLDYDRTGYKFDLLCKLQVLLIWRDAYWKIERDWKPDWEDGNTTKYTISCVKNKIELRKAHEYTFTLAFPTEEMRDAFYENFKELIEECKELL